MSKRAEVVEIATGEIGKSDANKYWRGVLPSGPPYPPHWCGAFALWCLRAAGLTDWHWAIGKGFLYSLPRTQHPEPGDIGYQDQPFQHHFVVTELGKLTFTSVDGNQGKPGVQERHRKLDLSKYAFFSIAPLLNGESLVALPLSILRRGSTGSDVVTLQQALGIKADGVFGPATEASVRAFQSSKGLAADGVVGAITWGALLKP